MTNEEIRIKIAETLGWTDIHKFEGYLLGWPPNYKLPKDINRRHPLVIPNWPDSLDTCYPLMAEITPTEQVNFLEMYRRKDKYSSEIMKRCVIATYWEPYRSHVYGEDKSSYATAFCLAYLRWKGVKICKA